MSDFTSFMKANKKAREHIFYPATASLCDENGRPLLWELRAVTAKENDRIRDFCTSEVPIKGKSGQYRLKVDTELYVKKLICACVVVPDLNNKELQDSYGVMTPEDLLMEMVDTAGEYSDLSLKVQELNGFSTLQEDVDEAKNS